jgi:hypothetical protein
MISCDYNGWTDLPEDEREGIDTFETGIPCKATIVLLTGRLPVPITARPKAA